MGKSLIELPECPSTNTLAMEMSQAGKAPEGTVIITHRQTSGRGQRGNTWESPEGVNLTFTVVVNPVFLIASQQFQLNKAVALAVSEVITRYVPGETVRVKWPNDIMIGSKKTCGILIENQLTGNKISRSIIGIGLNVNQGEFDLPSATSVSLHTGSKIDLPTMFNELMHALEGRYLQLKGGQSARLNDDYLKVLYWKDELRNFEIASTGVKGMIRGVDTSGKLEVEIDHQLRSFDLKEIKHLN